MWKKKSMIGTIISMMTEKEFWDTFNKKHNPGYYYVKTKNKKENQKKNQKQKDHTIEYKVFRKQD